MKGKPRMELEPVGGRGDARQRCRAEQCTQLRRGRKLGLISNHRCSTRGAFLDASLASPSQALSQGIELGWRQLDKRGPGSGEGIELDVYAAYGRSEWRLN